MAKQKKPALSAAEASAKKSKHDILLSLDDERKESGLTLSNEQLEFIAKYVKAVNG